MGSRKQKPNKNWKRKREKRKKKQTNGAHTGEHSVDEIISNFIYRLWSREQTAHIGH